jgi:hypothetical protein
MKTIKFSHDYPKLWGQKTAILTHMVAIAGKSILHKDFLEYDTKTKEGEYYPLPDTKLIILYFEGDKRIPFCTTRRFTQEKYDYYADLVGSEFNIVIEEK